MRLPGLLQLGSSLYYSQAFLVWSCDSTFLFLPISPFPFSKLQLEFVFQATVRCTPPVPLWQGNCLRVYTVLSVF